MLYIKFEGSIYDDISLSKKFSIFVNYEIFAWV